LNFVSPSVTDIPLPLSPCSFSYPRPLFSQGDIAVGRITRQDVASVLVSILEEGNAEAAVGKTVEVLALSGTVYYISNNVATFDTVLFSHVHVRIYCRYITSITPNRSLPTPYKSHIIVLVLVLVLVLLVSVSAFLQGIRPQGTTASS
jgi:choline-glycine betaine transporter